VKKIIAFILIALISTVFLSCKKETVENVEAKIAFSIGTVTVNGSAVTIGHIVNDGDIIETAEKSLMRLQIGDKTMIQLKADSRLVYKMESEQLLQLDKGWMAGVTRGKLTKTGKYNIKTPTAVAAVRGTAYCIKVESEDSTYFCTCNGTTSQHPGGDDSEYVDVTATHHNPLRYTRNGDSVTVEKAEMEYHDDDDIEGIAKMIGETIDWNKEY
jgi:hypothetical protein